MTTPSVGTARRAGLQPLNLEQCAEILDGWAGRIVAVRVVAERDDLLAVFRGELGARSPEKRPALFWPLTTGPDAAGMPHVEVPGLYLHPERFQSAALHVGGWVLELRQGAITLNVRRH